LQHQSHLVGYTAKIIPREISRAALVDQLGLIGEKNATGDAQKKLDVLINQTVIEAFSNTGLVAALVSEELDEPQYLDCRNNTPYSLLATQNFPHCHRVNAIGFKELYPLSDRSSALMYPCLVL
jgi:fructose-1,6-bisphosphatase